MREGRRILLEWRNNDKTLEILRERYAGGEIKKEEFEQNKKELRW
ncbi:MAG: SHOCT domain-containing protein [Patescibacteria group bacterium]|nr:SHOCT domain-containing protein [Patescibacteria group bacterium]